MKSKMIRNISSRNLLLILAACIGVVCFVAVITFSNPRTFSENYYVERIEFALQPSAERAFEFGMRHFNPSNPSAYNLQRAEYFLRATIAIDPPYPFANQQLARINFLQGEFVSATTFINQEIALQSDPNPSAYYIRGLIRGYQGSYIKAADDFERYVQMSPEVWAGYNDLAWVLMKSGEYQRALGVLIRGLAKFPDNAWLLNSFAIALYETGDAEGAKAAALRARDAVEKLTPQDWSNANPGNDARIAAEGLETFRSAALKNLEKISRAAATSSIEVVR